MALISSREMKTQGIGLLVSALTGEFPELNRQPNYTEIILTPGQVAQGRNWLTELMSTEPGEVRIKGINQIVGPVALKQYLPFVIGIPAGLIILGALLRGKK